MKNLKIFVSFFLFFPLFFSFAQPIDLFVFPTVIDEKLLPRDLRDYQVSIKNNRKNLVYVYPLVFDILPDGQRKLHDPYSVNPRESLGSWIKIQRSVIELWPQKEIKIPLSLEIHPEAKPGIYHSAIVFSFGSALPDAVSNAQSFRLPEILLNVEVKENIVEQLQLKNFKTEKNLYLSGPVKFILEIENVGNTKTEGEGEIYLYNKKGKEIDSIPVKVSLEGGRTEKFEFSWNPKATGQIKARIFLEYGKEKKEIQDAIFFTFLSWKSLALLIGVVLILILILIKLINKKSFGDFPEKILKPVINLRKK
jgi:hypothetical protein